jgi:gliding motility-associated-like protein
MNALGCDSIVTTNLTVQPSILKYINISICSGDNYIFNGHIYSIAGVYMDTLLSQFFCDTIVSTTLAVLPATMSTQNFNICNGDNITVNGHVYTTSGNFIDTVLNSLGCDSVINTSLNVAPNSFLSQEISICKGHTLKINDHIYSSSGIYIDTFHTFFGCDSILSTKLIVNNALAENLFISNVFTPNNDNLNDCFGVTYWKDIQEIKFLIYNRWGELVFKTDQVWDCWNGNYKGGLSEQGVYYYYIKAKTSCGYAEFKGDVTLLR